MTQTPTLTFSEELAGPVEGLMQYLIDRYCPSVGALRVPVDPDWDITPYNQERMPVYEALERFAMMIGWDLRWRWLPGSRMTGQVTFFRPDLASSIGVGPDEIIDFARFDESIEGVRDHVYVVYGPAEARAITEAKLPSPRFRFYRIMWIEESSNSPLQTLVEAQRMADKALADLSGTRPDAELKIFFNPLWELHDFAALNADGVQVGSSTNFTVTGIRHEFGGGARPTTTLSLSDGRAAAGSKRWLRREFREGVRYL